MLSRGTRVLPAVYLQFTGCQPPCRPLRLAARAGLRVDARSDTEVWNSWSDSAQQARVDRVVGDLSHDDPGRIPRTGSNKRLKVSGTSAEGTASIGVRADASRASPITSVMSRRVVQPSGRSPGATLFMARSSGASSFCRRYRTGKSDAAISRCTRISKARRQGAGRAIDHSSAARAPPARRAQSGLP